jgi:hypothetical protein
LLAQERVLGDELLPRADHVPEQPTDRRGGSRCGAHGRLHALGRPAREAMKPTNEGSKHDPNVQRPRDRFNLVRPGFLSDPATDAKSGQHRYFP